MVLRYVDRVMHATVSTGTGALELGQAFAGYQSVAEAGIDVGDTIDVCIVDPISGAWETTRAVLIAPNTIDRGAIRDSSANGDRIDFGFGVKRVQLVLPAADIAEFADSVLSEDRLPADTLTGAESMLVLQGGKRRRASLEDHVRMVAARRAGLMFGSIAEAAALVVGLGLTFGAEIATAAHTSPGDTGGGLHMLVESEPDGEGKWQDNAGRWWRLTSESVRPAQFGAFGTDGSVDDRAALHAAMAWCKPGQVVELRPCGIYGLREPLVIPDKRGPAPSGGLNGTGLVCLNGKAMLRALPGAVDTICVICAEKWNTPGATSGNVAPVLRNIYVDANFIRTMCFATVSNRGEYVGNFFFNSLGDAALHENRNRYGEPCTAYVGDNLWEGNTFRLAGARGLKLDSIDCVVRGNFASGCWSWGMDLSCGGLRATDNKAWSNGRDGISGCIRLNRYGYGTIFEDNHCDIAGFDANGIAIPGGVLINKLQGTTDSGLFGTNHLKCPLYIKSREGGVKQTLLLKAPRFQRDQAFLHLDIDDLTTVVVEGGIIDHVHPIQWKGESLSEGTLVCKKFYSMAQDGYFDGIIHPYQPFDWQDGPAANLKSFVKVNTDANTNPVTFSIELKVADNPRASTALTVNFDLSSRTTAHVPTFWSGTILANYTREGLTVNSKFKASVVYSNSDGGGFADPVLAWSSDDAIGEQTATLTISFPTADLSGNPSTAQMEVVRSVHHGIRQMSLA